MMLSRIQWLQVRLGESGEEGGWMESEGGGCNPRVGEFNKNNNKMGWF